MGRPVLKRRQRSGKLTPRELSVLRLASYCKSLTEIAARMKISSETVRTYLKRVARKNRAHAIGEAYRQGLLN
jgi:DNA-binding CsgD family transcriptional regulator